MKFPCYYVDNLRIKVKRTLFASIFKTIYENHKYEVTKIKLISLNNVNVLLQCEVKNLRQSKELFSTVERYSSATRSYNEQNTVLLSFFQKICSNY